MPGSQGGGSRVPTPRNSRPATPQAQGSRPGTPQGSRPPTPQAHRAGVTVAMGGVAYMDTKTGKWSMYNSDPTQPKGEIKGTADANHLGILTRGMTSCFTVMVAGRDAILLAHVTAYLGQPNLDAGKRRELEAMRAAFKKFWDAHKRELSPTTAVVVKGPSTNGTQMNALVATIFPELSGSGVVIRKDAKCDDLPANRTASHGTAMVVKSAGGTEFLAEDKHVL